MDPELPCVKLAQAARDGKAPVARIAAREPMHPGGVQPPSDAPAVGVDGWAQTAQQNSVAVSVQSWHGAVNKLEQKAQELTKIV